jgi:hypothetical protein
VNQCGCSAQVRLPRHVRPPPTAARAPRQQVQPGEAPGQVQMCTDTAFLPALPLPAALSDPFHGFWRCGTLLGKQWRLWRGTPGESRSAPGSSGHFPGLIFGRFGWQAVDKNNGRKYAVKIIHKKRFNSNSVRGPTAAAGLRVGMAGRGHPASIPLPVPAWGFVWLGLVGHEYPQQPADLGRGGYSHQAGPCKCPSSPAAPAAPVFRSCLFPSRPLFFHSLPLNPDVTPRDVRAAAERDSCA